MTQVVENLIVHHLRNGHVDGEQYVDAVAVDRYGSIVAEWGKSDTTVITHSSCKPFHSVAFVESGSVDRFDLTEAEIALSAASQGGEKFQREILSNWLDRIGLQEKHLLCGAHPPLSAVAREELAAHSLSPTALHHNSAGKHIAMLSMCLHLGFPIDEYVKAEHPVQKYLWKISSEMLSTDEAISYYALERCETVIPVIPLLNLARAAVRFCEVSSSASRNAVRRVKSAFLNNRDLITYPSHYINKLHSVMEGDLFVKTGSYAVCAACHIPSGTGIAFKVRDGADNLRLSCVIAPILRRLGLIDDPTWISIGDIVEPKIIGSTGKELGRTKISFVSR